MRKSGNAVLWKSHQIGFLGMTIDQIRGHSRPFAFLAGCAFLVAALLSFLGQARIGGDVGTLILFAIAFYSW
jgi:hypothetical protein